MRVCNLVVVTQPLLYFRSGELVVYIMFKLSSPIISIRVAKVFSLKLYLYCINNNAKETENNDATVY